MAINDDYLLEILLHSGLVTYSQLEKARKEGANGEKTAIDALVDDEIVTWEDVSSALAAHAGMACVDFSLINVDEDVIQQVPGEATRRYKVVPIAESDGCLVIATADPLDFEVLDSVRFLLKRDVEFVCATPEQIEAALMRYYGNLNNEVNMLAAEIGDVDITGESDVASTEGEPTDAPVIKMVSMLLLEAYKMRASDIHLEPLEKRFRVRFRIDGVLHEVRNPPKKLQSAILSRLKIMTGTMSIAEKRLPQDGRIQVKIGKNSIDLRVSTIPTSHGESMVMRILDKSSLALGLPQLGFLTDDQETMEHLLGLPDGIILVTGPTGSGKTTTLYACLNSLNKSDRKIITVEDPVEYQISGINQVQVKADIGMTFPAALRAMLRQAPNIIMIGEIRDVETASIAINASLTGHLVFSTLHTNDAPSAIARLVDIGIQPFLVSSSVRAIMAQRLVRKLCPKCKQPHKLTGLEMRALQLETGQIKSANVMKPVGCDSCRNLGYRGRMAVFEIFLVDDEVRFMVNERASTAQLRKRARELGMRTLREDGIRKVLAGLTSVNEVIATTLAEVDAD